MKKLEKSDLFLIILFVIIVVVTIISFIYRDVGALLDVSNWFDVDALGTANYWVAIGIVSLICFIGAIIPIPVPYMIPVALFSAAWVAGDPNTAGFLITGIVVFSALSNTIGDLLDYYIGRGAEYVLNKDDQESQNRWAKIILKKPKVIPWVIIIFGISPLPESLLMVPLGMVKYNVKKTFIWMLLGKIIMMLIMALLGIFAQQFLGLFSGEGITGLIIGTASLYIMYFMIVFFFKFKPKEDT
jgi:membrane protein YqaA with SNARE-associated domain